MENKRLGAVLFFLSVVLLVLFVVLLGSLRQEAQALGCFEQQGCQSVETSLSIVHFAFGIFGFLFSLSFYLFVFGKGEDAIVRRLEKDSSRKLSDERFSLVLLGLDEFEKAVITAIREQPGITQNTLRLRVAMSKAKLSQVLSDLEKKNLVRKEQEKKTNALYLARDF